MKSFATFCWVASLWLGLLACKSGDSQQASTDPLEFSLARAGDNADQIRKVLSHYQTKPQDSLKYQAAVLLISNIEHKRHYVGDNLKTFDAAIARLGHLPSDSFKVACQEAIGQYSPEQEAEAVYDLSTISADFLIEHIDLAFEAWQKAPWHSQVSFEAFCEFILPYKNYSEYPERWRKPLLQRYGYLRQQPNANMMQASIELNNELQKWFFYDESLNNYPGRLSASMLQAVKHGNCNDMAGMGTYANRAIGIPVSIDFTPQWGNISSGHYWNALILSDTSSIPFMATETSPGKYDFFERNESKVAKAYRQMLSRQASSFAAKARARGIKQLPPNLRQEKILDVTTLYTQTHTVNVPVKVPDGTAVYLSLFAGNTWEPIAGTFAQNKQARFEAIGNNILYLPVLYNDNGNVEPAGSAFVITTHNDVVPLRPKSTTQRVLLTRKAPFKREYMKWSLGQYLYKGRFEGANRADFSDAEVLYRIPEPYIRYGYIETGGTPDFRDQLDWSTLWLEAPAASPKAFRYVRLISDHDPTNPLKVGEIRCWGALSNQALKGKPIGNVANPEWAFDGMPGRSVVGTKPNKTGQWVGLDLGSPTRIRKFDYITASDNSQVISGQLYELFYWDGKWISLGKKQTTHNEIVFENAPVGVLFKLSCLSKAGAERPFTYENGKQVWW